jgi:hypothetical protein
MSPKCTTRGCPVRYRDGGDRPCTDHRHDTGPTLEARMAAWSLLSGTAPGDHGDGGAQAADQAR